MADAALLRTCRPRATVWIGSGAAAYVGPALGLDPHSTSVPCLVVGIDDPVEARTPTESVRGRTVLIPSRTVHQVVVPRDTRVMFLYADTTAARHRDLVTRMLDSTAAILTHHAEEKAIIDVGRRDRPDLTRVFELLHGSRVQPLDPRVQRVLRRLRADPAAAISADALAGEVGVSTSYLLRRFAAETGTSFRRYRIWVRMLTAARAVADGADLTRAAADAGFASPSHLSDTFRRLFGLTASDLLDAGVEIVADERPAP